MLFPVNAFVGLMSVYSISKTSFLKFEQCAKAFFFYKNHPYLRDKLSIDKQLTFKRGHDVGDFAQQLFPGGVDVSKQTKQSAEGVAITAALINSQAPVIYEATFMADGVLIMVDILHFDGTHYRAYEVKSSIKISETYLKDAYLQYYVLKKSLPGLEDLFLVTLNPDYVLEGELDVKKLFRRRSVKQKAEDNLAYFEHKIGLAHEVLEKNVIPNIPIGRHCFRPYTCDYFGTCWKEVLHEDSVFHLPLIDKNRLFDWYENGVTRISQLRNEDIDKASWIKLKEATVHQTVIVDKPNIERFLEMVKEPVAAMDMEIWSAAIPQLQQCSPFEQIPFLACFYNGETYSHCFSELKTDDRHDFAQALIHQSEPYASILVYDKTMEVGAINKLIHKFEDCREGLETLKSKLVDVFDLFLGLSYYDPQFKNNFSLKGVSQVLLQEVAYPKIGSGLEAMNYFEQYRAAETDLLKAQIRQELVDYCNTDSLATYGLYTFFKKYRT